MIHYELRQAGVILASATEAINGTPSGMLVQGIMSSIAEFYSLNLATEVTKGLVQKPLQVEPRPRHPFNPRPRRTRRGLTTPSTKPRPVHPDANDIRIELKEPYTTLSAGDPDEHDATEHQNLAQHVAARGSDKDI